MAILKVLEYNDPALRRCAKPIHKITNKIKKLAEDMIETLHSEQGIGLAAPQVGNIWRLIVVDLTGEAPMVIINPKLQLLQPNERSLEGCLSLPGLYGIVERSKKVIISGLDINGKPIKFEAENLLARAFQHESDHLNGILFIDKVEPRSLHFVMPQDAAMRIRQERLRIKLSKVFDFYIPYYEEVANIIREAIK